MGRKLLNTVQIFTTFRNPLADPIGTRRGPPLVRGPQFENRWSTLRSAWLSCKLDDVQNDAAQHSGLTTRIVSHRSSSVICLRSFTSYICTVWYVKWYAYFTCPTYAYAPVFDFTNPSWVKLTETCTRNCFSRVRLWPVCVQKLHSLSFRLK